MSSYISGLYAPYMIGECVDWDLKTWERLAFIYGPERASLIQEGRDPKTQADLAAWRNLGQRSAA